MAMLVHDAAKHHLNGDIGNSTWWPSDTQGHGEGTVEKDVYSI